MAEPFTKHSDAALALLNSGERLSRKAGSFLGQLVVDPTPLTDRQADWLDTLPKRLAAAGVHTSVISDYAGDFFPLFQLGFERRPVSASLYASGL